MVGWVTKDREGIVCDDSCEYAFDGVCDEPGKGWDFYGYDDTYYYDRRNIDDYNGQNVDDDYLATAYAYNSHGGFDVRFLCVCLCDFSRTQEL